MTANDDAPITILLDEPLPEDFLARARALSPRVRFLTGADLAGDPAVLGTVEIIYGWVQPEWWARATALRWVQAMSSGVERMLIPAGRAHPAILTNVHIHAEPIAEHLFGLLLALTRKLQLAYTLQQAHTWQVPALIDVLAEKTLGILGLGAIGSRAAQVGRAFGMRILALRHTAHPSPLAEAIYTTEQLPVMLPQCDVLMLTLPLTAETYHIIGAAELALLKPSALLLNIGRGALVDTDALVDALRSGHLGGAGLDVVDPEPLPPDHPLWALPNTLITAHYAGAHPTYAKRAATIFLDNLQRYLAGQPLVNQVDKSVGY